MSIPAPSPIVDVNGKQIDLTLSTVCAKRKAAAKSEKDLVYRLALGGKELDCFDMRILSEFYEDHPEAFGVYPTEKLDGSAGYGTPVRLPQEVQDKFVVWAQGAKKTEMLNGLDFELKTREKQFNQKRNEAQKQARSAVKHPGGMEDFGSNGISNTFHTGNSVVFDKSRDASLPEHLLKQTVGREQEAYDFSIDDGVARAAKNEARLRELTPLCKPLGGADQLEVVIKRACAFGGQLARTPPQILAAYPETGVRIGFDTLSNADMFFVSFENLLAIDYEAEAVTAAGGGLARSPWDNLNARFCPMLDQIHRELAYAPTSESTGPMRFLVFETDSGGQHVFCTSHKQNSRNLVSLQLMCLLRGDFAYVCGTPVRGWSMRAGPKRLRYKKTGAYGGYTYKPDQLLAVVEYDESSQKYKSRMRMDEKFEFDWLLKNPHPQDDPELLQSLATWNAFQARIADVLRGIGKRLTMDESQAYDVLATLVKERNVGILDNLRDVIASIDSQLGGRGGRRVSSKEDKLLSPTRALVATAESEFADNLDARKREFIARILAQTPDDTRSFWEQFKSQEEGAHMFVRLLRLLPRLYGQRSSSRYKMDTSLLEAQFDMRYGTNNIGRDDYVVLDKDDPSLAKGSGIAWIASTKKNKGVSMTFIVPINQLVSKVLQSMDQSKASVIPVSYFLHWNSGTHINAVLINVHDRVVEHFESHGTTDDGREELVQEFVRELNAALVSADSNAKPFDLLTPDDICPVGVQKGSLNSFCMAYSLFFFHLRFLFPEVDPTKVIDWVLGPEGAAIRDNDQRLQFIQSYVTYVFELVQAEEAKSVKIVAVPATAPTKPSPDPSSKKKSWWQRN